MNSCVADVNALLSYIIETCDCMITITVKKHLAENLSPVFTMLNKFEGVSESSSILKLGGDNFKPSKKEDPKPTVNPTIKPKTKNEPKDKVASDSKGKEKLNEEPIIDDIEEEDPDENELKRTRAREAQLDEHNRIVHEVEEKERVEHEAHVTLESRKICFHCGYWSES